MKLFFGVIILLIVIGLPACGDDDSNVEPIDTVNPVNDWIFSVMDFWYLWRDEMPSDISQTLDTDEYFAALLYEGDRFSILIEDYQAFIDGLDGITLEAGYELSLFQEVGTDNVIGAITYVKVPSPAADAGLKRGDLIQSVNGQLMDIGNYQNVLSNIFQTHSIEFLRYNEDLDEYEENTQELTVEQVIENPHFLDTVYTTQNGKKVGYYVYNFFRDGVDGGMEYSVEMDEIFEGFEAEGIDELILDLRYNGGGSVSSAVDLASLIAPGVTSEDNFYRNQLNEIAEEALINDPDFGLEFLAGNFLDKSANIGESLSADRLYVLTGSGTASASELIINGLSPFLNVTIIGDTTVGKNVGSYVFEDTQNENSTYGMAPITFQIANSLGQSSYADGFIPAPQYLVHDLQLPLKPLGDTEEPLLATALADIEGQLGGRLGQGESIGLHTIITTKQLKPFRNELILGSTGLLNNP